MKEAKGVKLVVGGSWFVDVVRREGEHEHTKRIMPRITPVD